VILSLLFEVPLGVCCGKKYITAELSRYERYEPEGKMGAGDFFTA